MVSDADVAGVQDQVNLDNVMVRLKLVQWDLMSNSSIVGLLARDAVILDVKLGRLQICFTRRVRDTSVAPEKNLAGTPPGLVVGQGLFGVLAVGEK